MKQSKNTSKTLPISIQESGNTSVRQFEVDQKQSTALIPLSQKIMQPQNQINYYKQSQLLQSSLNSKQSSDKIATKSKIVNTLKTLKSEGILSNNLSEGSFNNVTIKSVDRHNSIAGPQLNFMQMHPLSAKNTEKKQLASFQGQIVQQPMRPVAYHSKNTSIGAQSFSSAQSRFTMTRPKNPATDHSISSKGSVDSIGINSAAVVGGYNKQKMTQPPLNSTIQTVHVNINGKNRTEISPKKNQSVPKLVLKIQNISVPAANTTKTITSPKTMSSIAQKQNLKSLVKKPQKILHTTQPLIGGSKKVKPVLAKKMSILSKGPGQGGYQSNPLLKHDHVSTTFDDSNRKPRLGDVLEEQLEDSNEHIQRDEVVKISKKSPQLQCSVSQKKLVKSHNLVLDSNKSQSNLFASSSSPKANAIKEKISLSKLLTESYIKDTHRPLFAQTTTNINLKATSGIVDDDLRNVGVSNQITSLKQQLKMHIQSQKLFGVSNNRTSDQKAHWGSDQLAFKQSQPAQPPTVNSFNDLFEVKQNSNPQQPSSQIGLSDSFPMHGRQALLQFQNQLTDYEKIEIQSFSTVYFIGNGSTRKIKASSMTPHNSGYDDERGDYQIVMKDHLAYRYEVLDKLGSGSFGQAVKCFDYKLKQMVAVKVIRNKKRFQYQSGVELNILQYLNDADKQDANNIIRMLDFEMFRKHLLISFELLSINLYEFIKNNNFQGVSLSLIRRFAIQILQALKFQRDHNVIHCDLKPENILLKQANKSGLKIIDYGSSCFQDQRIYTYIQSRFYRAPEIILGIPYTAALDMWSFGCIIAELYSGYPLFPGENEQDQLAQIMQARGLPPSEILDLATRRTLFFDDQSQPIIVANSRGKKRRPNSKPLNQILSKCSDRFFLDFLEKCLSWDPISRLSPLEALQHQWILAGLPEKVLYHHSLMFCGNENQEILRTYTHTGIQGFPQEANEKSIAEIVKQLKTKISEAAPPPRAAFHEIEERKESNSSNSQKPQITNSSPQKKDELANKVNVNRKQTILYEAPQRNKKQQLTIEIFEGEVGSSDGQEHIKDKHFIQQIVSKASPQIIKTESSNNEFSANEVCSNQSNPKKPEEDIVSSEAECDSPRQKLRQSKSVSPTDVDEGDVSMPANERSISVQRTTQRVPQTLIKLKEKTPSQYSNAKKAGQNNVSMFAGSDKSIILKTEVQDISQTSQIMQHPSMYRPLQAPAPRLNNYIKQAQVVKNGVQLPQNRLIRTDLFGLLGQEKPPRVNLQSHFMTDLSNKSNLLQNNSLKDLVNYSQ